MKHLSIPLFAFALTFASSSEALPQKWDVDLAAQPPQVFTIQRPRGETYELEAVLKDHGKPFEPAITNARIYWQTNGMENLYWSAPASVSNNVLRATWLPSMDPGATTVRGYIGDPGHIYAAAFQFRFIASPGETPNELPLPQPVIDFAKVTVLNPPWSGGGGGVDTNAVREIVKPMIAASTNRLRRVEDMAVYERKKFDTWKLVSHDLNQTNTAVGVFSGTWGWHIDGENVAGATVAAAFDENAIVIDWTGDPEIGFYGVAYRDLGNYVPSTNAAIAAVVTNGTGKVTEGDMVKVDANGRLVKATAGEDYAEQGEVDQIKSSVVDIGSRFEIHSSNTNIHVDPDEKTVWYSKADRATTLSGYGITDAAPLSMISATDPTFSNEVATVSRTVSPPPSPHLRLYDEVRQCWWIGRMVNGVINWEVE